MHRSTRTTQRHSRHCTLHAHSTAPTSTTGTPSQSGTSPERRQSHRTESQIVVEMSTDGQERTDVGNPGEAQISLETTRDSTLRETSKEIVVQQQGLVNSLAQTQFALCFLETFHQVDDPGHGETVQRPREIPSSIYQDRYRLWTPAMSGWEGKFREIQRSPVWMAVLAA